MVLNDGIESALAFIGAASATYRAKPRPANHKEPKLQKRPLIWLVVVVVIAVLRFAREANSVVDTLLTLASRR